MTQPRRIFSFAVFVAAVLLMPDSAAAQNYVTPTVKPTPPRKVPCNTQTAINILTALKNQINAQAGKHIATACSIAGVAFNPVTVLLLDVQGVIASLRVSAIPDPITGYVVDMNGMGVAGAAVSTFDAGNNVVATATTDITGFYFFATMSVLSSNATYTVAVSGLPAGFTSSRPAASPAFIWSGTGMMMGGFVLNP